MQEGAREQQGSAQLGDAAAASDSFVGTRRAGFTAALVAVLFVLVIISPAILVVVGWFLEAYEEATGASTVSHRVHEVSFGIMFTLALVGALSQLRHPRRNIAGMQQLLIVTIVFTVVVTITGRPEWGAVAFYVVPAFAAAALHPARREIIRPRVNPWRFGLWMTAIGGAFGPAAQREVERAFDDALNHRTHWGAMAAFFITISALSLLASLRPPGYRIVAYSVGGAALGFAAAAFFFPFDASARPFAWGLFAAVWGIIWIVAAARASDPPPPSPKRPWEGKYSRIIRVLTWVGVLILLLVPLIGIPIALVLLLAALVLSVIQAARSDALSRWAVSAARIGGFVFLGVVVSLMWLVSLGTPTVSHGLIALDENGEVVSTELTRDMRATCLGCHSTGAHGAPIRPHSPRVCGSDGGQCWGGRTDCLGCHRMNPRFAPELGELALQMEVDHASAVMSSPRVALAPEQLAGLAVALGRSP